MSAAQLIDLLGEYVRLHERLLESARTKTEVLKKGDMEALTAMIKEEQKQIAAVSQLEKERMQLMERIAQQSGHLGEELTLTACIEWVEEPKKSVLKRLQEELSAVVSELKNVNQLNQQLIQQSLQFVNMTLNFILPQPPEVNYRHPNSTSSSYENSRSIFDSKA
ncbi:flagellar protein FlgN [Anoxybacteroides tepidamans]|uniref:flagellar protein FlgN n=1 Tax=Anoxybacteroides tepidamans TaxID=265948 RepID=UPI000481B1D1|nr:flagellar protein FlgN [Anoxybacillus tepidamans]